MVLEAEVRDIFQKPLAALACRQILLRPSPSKLFLSLPTASDLPINTVFQDSILQQSL